MSRLPIPGSDNGAWGAILNDFLSAAHNSDGSLKASSVAGAVPVSSVNGQIGAVALSYTDVGADGSGSAAAAVVTAPAFVRYSSSWPTRATATADAARTVIWIGPIAPSIGGSGAVNGVDVWWKTP